MLPSSFDLNLLRPLLALLEERSVTRAAHRLRVSQPTASVALSRLRAHFADPLLTRRGASHDLTPLAERLLARLPAVIGQLDSFLSLGDDFDPATSRHEFVIAAVDYAARRYGGPLSRRFAREAPHARLTFRAADPAIVRGAPESLRGIDGVILPHGYLIDQPHIELGSDPWLCVVDADAPAHLTREALLRRPWVATLDTRDGLTPARQQIELLGLNTDVTAVTPNFHVVPSLVAGSDRVALLPASLAQWLAASDSGIRTLVPPFDLTPIRDSFWWHPEREWQPEHRWLRAQLSAVADELSIRNQDDGHPEHRLPR